MSRLMNGDLKEQLERWTAAGLIDPAQASRIEAAEAAGALPSAARPARSRLPLVVEALGYLGAVVATAAAFIAVQQFWPHIPTAVLLTFFGVVAAGLTWAGGALKAAGEPALGRLRSVLWLLATAAAAVFAAVLADGVLRLGGATVGVIAAVTWTAWEIPLWWRARSVLSHLSVFAGAVAVVETGIARIASSPPDWQLGVGLWALSVLWGAAAWRGYLIPRTAGLAAAGSGVLVGAILTMSSAGGPVFALATVAGLLALGVALRRGLLLGLGAAGLIWVVPQAADRYLPGSVARPVAVALVGLLLLAIALWLAWRRPSRTGAREAR